MIGLFHESSGHHHRRNYRAGKSQTISALTNDAEFHNGWTPYDIYPEEETFGEFMLELLTQPETPPSEKFRLLARVIRAVTTRATEAKSYRFIMERAHHSYYSLLPNWDLYRDFDREIAALDPHVYLLWLPEELLKVRSLHRVDRPTYAEGFVEITVRRRRLSTQ